MREGKKNERRQEKNQEGNGRRKKGIEEKIKEGKKVNWQTRKNDRKEVK